MADPKHPGKFSEEFKRQAVEMHDNGKPASEILGEHDLGSSAFHRWVRAIHGSGSTGVADNRTPGEQELVGGAQGEPPAQDGGRRLRTGGADIRTEVAAITASAGRYPVSAQRGILGAPRSTHYAMRGYPIILSQSRIEYCDQLAAMTEEERTAKIIAETHKVLPDFPEKPKIVKNYRWDISINCEGPGQFKAVNNLKKNHMDDVEGLHLAGDYMFLIASTEGSIDAGRRRAEEILATLGIALGKRRK